MTYSTSHVVIYNTCQIPQHMLYSTAHVILHSSCHIPRNMAYSTGHDIFHPRTHAHDGRSLPPSCCAAKAPLVGPAEPSGRLRRTPWHPFGWLPSPKTIEPACRGDGRRKSEFLRATTLVAAPALRIFKTYCLRCPLGPLLVSSMATHCGHGIADSSHRVNKAIVTAGQTLRRTLQRASLERPSKGGWGLSTCSSSIPNGGCDRCLCRDRPVWSCPSRLVPLTSHTYTVAQV